jgi:hypothetical protein
MSWEPPIRPSWERGFQRAFPWVVAALALAVIAPALRSGWVGDDAFYSVLDGVLGADRVSLLAAMRHAFELWFFGSGRFYPLLIVEKYLVFAVFTNLVVYKSLLVAATLATLRDFSPLHRRLYDAGLRQSLRADRRRTLSVARLSGCDPGL